MNAENAKPSVSIWNANYVKLIIANFFYCMGVSVIVTVLPLRAYELNVAPAIIGTIVGCFAITALLSRPFTGPAFDSFPKKTILTISYVVMIVCTFLYAFVESVPVLIGIRLVHGAGIGCGEEGGKGGEHDSFHGRRFSDASNATGACSA